MKSSIAHHYTEVREILSTSLNELGTRVSTNSEEENVFFEEMLNCLLKENKNFQKEIDELKDISDWDNFCISFFGETNAGKSTIIETLRIIYDEESRRKKIKKNNSGFFSFLKKTLLKMGFKAGSETKIARFLNSNGNVVDGEIIGTGRSDYTKGVTGYKLHYNQKPFILYDVPGIEGDESKFEKVIHEAVNKAHLIFYVNGSSKKPEPGTAEKIKKYLKNYTEVYSIINVHFPPKANRDIEIDDSYSEELKKEYRKMEGELKCQTDTVLSKALEENYKESVMINGLSAFCAHAYDEQKGLSTIIPDDPKLGEKKMLNSNQEKFFKEYNNDVSAMKEDSQIYEITKIISNKAENFEPFIIESNKKKLQARIDESFKTVKEQKDGAIIASDKFTEEYQQMRSSVKNAYDSFDAYMRNNYITNVVTRCINSEYNKFCEFIDVREGKLKKEDYESYFNSRQRGIEEEIQNGLKEDFQQQVDNFSASIKRAQERLDENVESFLSFSDIDFPVLANVNFSSLQAQYSLKDLGFDVLNIGGWAVSGFAIGTLLPGLGNILGAAIGAAVGALVGFIFKLISIFQSKKNKIAKAKEKAREVFTDLKIDIIYQLESSIDLEDIVQDVKDTKDKIIDRCETAVHQFEYTVKVLENLVQILEKKQKQIKEMPYGKI